MQIQPLFNVSFLASKWEAEYQAFKESDEARNFLDRLQSWAKVFFEQSEIEIRV